MPSTISAGTTAGTAIAIAGDTTGNLAFQTNGTTTAMTIDTSQNVGIGTTTPAAKLNIFQSGNGYCQLNYGNTAEDGAAPLLGSLNNASPASATTGWGFYDSNSTGNLVLYRRNFSTTGVKTAEWNRSNGNFSFDSGYGSAAVAYGCRAWVNFNGQGTPAIRASGNVSSITDNGVGRYTLNLSTALPDVNFALAGNASFRDSTDDGNSGVVAIRRLNSVSITTTAIPIQTTYYGANGTLDDFPFINAMVIR